MKLSAEQRRHNYVDRRVTTVARQSRSIRNRDLHISGISNNACHTVSFRSGISIHDGILQNIICSVDATSHCPAFTDPPMIMMVAMIKESNVCHVAAYQIFHRSFRPA